MLKRLLFLALAISTLIQYAAADYFPAVDITKTWQAPHMQPWDPLRAVKTHIQVTWTPAWNPWCALYRYELQVRRPKGHPLRFADLEPLRFRESQPEEFNWPGDNEWTKWDTTYVGQGRVYILRVDEKTAHAAQFRVRACGDKQGRFVQSMGCSAWSAIQTTHTVFSAEVDKINFRIYGTGMNDPGYTTIEVNRRTVYKRRDETGLILAVFRRLDFSLQWLKTYDTHRNRSQAVTMAKDLRMWNASHFVVVTSSIAWEWKAPRVLVQAMEFCGAYHFGQWSYVFAEQDHYRSNSSDLQQTASQLEFGHPYALIGIPGIGSGMGWESLMYNTGHYLAKDLKLQKATIQGVAYYDYVARLYRLQDVIATKADYFRKAQPPPPESLHNPVPKRKHPALDPITTIPELIKVYTPYVGTLRNHIPKLVEANETVPPFNYGFYLVTSANVFKVDPRPKSWWLTELERIWGGPSTRYWAHNGTRMQLGLSFKQRSCPQFVVYSHKFASPENCGGLDFKGCCPNIDAGDGLVATTCRIGVSPTLCRNSTVIVINQTGITYPENRTHPSKYPYDFWIVDWNA
eukprot:TRINITY_DN4297_c2_g1_i1.p1 TRINITY_DN4297_c2_g1~~TRINITY_DN4297_c2_g1_i1.p1  ORF type:complete len:573 (+),score=69.42 TRINITY_DN4297_c2_g1_i1:138-1856(+)